MCVMYVCVYKTLLCMQKLKFNFETFILGEGCMVAGFLGIKYIILSNVIQKFYIFFCLIFNLFLFRGFWYAYKCSKRTKAKKIQFKIANISRFTVPKLFSKQGAKQENYRKKFVVRKNKIATRAKFVVRA